VRSHLARENISRHTSVFLNSSGTNATSTLVMLQPENRFFLLTAQHVARIIEEQPEKWSYSNHLRVVRCLDHLPKRTDLGTEGHFSEDLTLLELHPEDAAEMVRLGLSFYDFRTSQYLSDEEFAPDYFIIGAPRSEEVIVNRELRFEIRCAGVNILEEPVVNDVTRFVEVEATDADYSGMSGGGLWEISYPASGGHRILLIGVVVKEPKQVQSTVDTCSSVGSTTIRCSSRHSVNELVAKARSLFL
jgi:hypothetical protein